MPREADSRLSVRFAPVRLYRHSADFRLNSVALRYRNLTPRTSFSILRTGLGDDSVSHAVIPTANGEWYATEDFPTGVRRASTAESRRTALIASRRIHAQLARLLDGLHLAEDGLDNRLATDIGGLALLGLVLARHPLLGRGVGGDRPARGDRLGV